MERTTRWGKVEQTVENIPQRHMAIWRTDANGQLGRNNRDPIYKRIIGPYTHRAETVKGADEEYTRHAKKKTA